MKEHNSFSPSKDVSYHVFIFVISLVICLVLVLYVKLFKIATVL